MTQQPPVIQGLLIIKDS